jgi:ATP-dependent Clp protease ATP-binding subunit ClpC
VFDIFTGPAKRVIIVAESEAVALGHDFIGPEHVLIGLAEVSEGLAGQVLAERGVTPGQVRGEAARLLAEAGFGGSRPGAADALAAIGIDVQEIQRRADATFGPGQFQFPRPVFTPLAKAVLEQSLAEARALGHDYIGTEHVLLALLADNDDADSAQPDSGARPDGGTRPDGDAGPDSATRPDGEARTRGIAILGAVGADPAALRQAVLARLIPQPS